MFTKCLILSVEIFCRFLEFFKLENEIGNITRQEAVSMLNQLNNSWRERKVQGEEQNSKRKILMG
ncbi:hypothetical protein MTR_2g099960 [Medicago truncatula]|uniref:Uncharacterized protein n=1 Tax=Medicago truncatula TaxID=3880 RepID=G7IUH3_MEDTR|nr:hypothetical protein MTR_2g099960 [Medicago truncatula]